MTLLKSGVVINGDDEQSSGPDREQPRKDERFSLILEEGANKVKNIFVKTLLSIVILLVIGGGILYFTDNRYILTYKSYSELKSAKSIEVDFTSNIGLGVLLNLSGNIKMLPETEQSLSNIELKAGIIPVNMDVYSEKSDVYYRINLMGMGWQKGVPSMDQGGFNPVAYSDALQKVRLLDMLKLASVFERSEKDNLIVYHTDSAFTLDQVKTFLLKALSITQVTIDEWDLTGYDLAVSFDRDTKILDSVSLTLKQNILSGESEFNLFAQIKGIDTFTSIEIPADLEK